MNWQVKGVRILSSGSSLSSNKITNWDLRPETAQWVAERLGIKERRILTENDSLSNHIEAAATIALERAGIKPKDLDAIIVATSTPDYLNPSMAAILHGRLGGKEQCMSYDIQAVCAGFIYALAQIASLISTGAGKFFLILGADQFSRITDFNHRNSVFFGDAAGAMVLEATRGDSELIVDVCTDGAGWDNFYTTRSSPRFVMNSKQVAENAKKKLPESIRRVTSMAGITPVDVKWFVTHQPSKPVLDTLEMELDLEPGKLQRNLEFRGNTAGATIPLLFDENGIIQKTRRGDYICFSAIGSGWVWGSAVLKFE